MRGPFYRAVCVSSVIGFACVFVSIYSASAAFEWFLSITAVTGFISWWGISFVHWRFRRAYIKQGRDLSELPFRAFAYPFSNLFACTLCVLIILGQGYDAFTPEFDRITFVTRYIGLVPFFLCYVIYKFARGTKIVPLLEVGKYQEGIVCSNFPGDTHHRFNRSRHRSCHSRTDRGSRNQHWSSSMVQACPRVDLLIFFFPSWACLYTYL